MQRVVAELEKLGCSVVVRHTSPGVGARQLAREGAPGFDAVVAAGGDGTVNEVANGLYGGSRPLAIIPLGTANVLAREIGLPRDPARLAALIAGGEPRPIWPGRVGERLFLMMAGCGFDAAVVEAVDPGSKKRFGQLAFVGSILRALLRYRPCELRVCADGVEHRAASIVVAKGQRYAGRFVLAPQARLSEPMLQIVLFRKPGRGAVLRALAMLALGRVHRLPEVAIIGARTVTLDAATPIPVQADGEIAGHVPVAIAVAAAPLALIAPPLALIAPH